MLLFSRFQHLSSFFKALYSINNASRFYGCTDRPLSPNLNEILDLEDGNKKIYSDVESRSSYGSKPKVKIMEKTSKED